MGSVPSEHTGVGSATNGTFLQIGGAFGVAVIGSLMATRYQHGITTVLAAHQSTALANAALGSLGGALTAAAHVGGPLGAHLAHAARVAFMSGMDLGLRVGALLALGGALLALVALPARPENSDG